MIESAPVTITEVSCCRCQTTAEPRVQVRNVAICAKCGSSLCVDAGGVRPAIHHDVETFSDDEMKQLRRGRGAVARPERTQR